MKRFTKPGGSEARRVSVSGRKPAGVSWESFVDRQIREAQERGEFDDLPGAGKPLPDLDRPHDEQWWIRRKLKNEGLSYVPPVLQLRKDIEDARARIARARTEDEVHDIVAEINVLIREANRTGLHGPSTTAHPLDEERAVQEWRRGR
jgi:hypothetical protein